jgi:hypothetical protein
MTRQELINIAGVGSIQTLINAEIVGYHPKIAVDGMFGPETLNALNAFVRWHRSPARQVMAEELKIPPLPETGYWENGVDVFQQWYKTLYYKVKEQYGTVHFRKPQKDGKWGENTYLCLVSLIADFNKP